jgi:uncharacterized protein YdeI (YjbR/CyaY-like superfamily)
MTETHPKADAFYARPSDWQDELSALRMILLDMPLTEDFKWNSPCYTHDGGNIVTVWGLRRHCALAFFKGALLEDPRNILVPPGENSRAMRTINFTDLAQIKASTDILRSYVLRAIETSGRQTEFAKDDLEYPEELIAALDEDSDLREAFDALTAGRRRGYVLHFSQPKQAATRKSRINKARPRIAEGKGLHDR